MESLVSETLRLSFGKCALQVQVPDKGPVQSVDQLAGKRIVTSFEVLAGRYFASIDDRVGLVGDARTSIEYVGGSVEAACALGLADAIGTYISFKKFPTPNFLNFALPTYLFPFSISFFPFPRRNKNPNFVHS
jgi:hypothetical protein